MATLPTRGSRRSRGASPFARNELDLALQDPEDTTKCKCCPYGYHIDVDFVRYCDQTQSSSHAYLKELKRSYRSKRKLRKSMEGLLNQPDSCVDEQPEHLPSGYASEPESKMVFSRPLHVLRNPSLPEEHSTYQETRQAPEGQLSPEPSYLPSDKPIYISTKNRQSENVAVTSPVILETNEALKDVVADFEEIFRNQEALSTSVSDVDDSFTRSSSISSSDSSFIDPKMSKSWSDDRHSIEKPAKPSPGMGAMGRSWTSGGTLPRQRGWVPVPMGDPGNYSMRTSGSLPRQKDGKSRPTISSISRSWESSNSLPRLKVLRKGNSWDGASNSHSQNLQTKNQSASNILPPRKEPVGSNAVSESDGVATSPKSPEKETAVVKKLNLDVSAIAALYGNRVEGLTKMYGKMPTFKPVKKKKSPETPPSDKVVAPVPPERKDSSPEETPPPIPPRPANYPLSNETDDLNLKPTSARESDKVPKFVEIFTPHIQSLNFAPIKGKEQNAVQETEANDVFKPPPSMNNTFPRRKQQVPQLSTFPDPLTPGILERTDSSSSVASDASFSSQASFPSIRKVMPSITASQIEANMAEIDARERKDSSGSSSFSQGSSNLSSMSPKQLEAIREQMALGLKGMRELEEKAKAIPVLQVKINVLKEEKRLLMLQLKAKEQALKNVRTKVITRSVGVGDYFINDSLDHTNFRARAYSSGSCTDSSVEREQSAPHKQQADFQRRSSVELVDASFGDGDVTKYEPEDKTMMSALHLQMHHTVVHSPDRTPSPTKNKVVKNMGIQADIEVKKASRTVGLNFKPLTREVGTVHTRFITNTRSTAAGDDSIEPEDVECAACEYRNNLEYGSTGVNCSVLTHSVGCGDFGIEAEQCVHCKARAKIKMISVGINSVQPLRTVGCSLQTIDPEPCGECTKRKQNIKNLMQVNMLPVSIQPEPCDLCMKRDSKRFVTQSSNTDTVIRSNKQTFTEMQIEERKLAEVKPLMKRDSMDQYTSTDDGSTDEMVIEGFENGLQAIQSPETTAFIHAVGGDVLHAEKVNELNAVKQSQTSFMEPDLLSSDTSVTVGDVSVSRAVELVDAAVGEETIEHVSCDICLVRVNGMPVATQTDMGSYLSSEWLISTAVGDDQISDFLCDKCAKLTHRTVGSGLCTVNELLCDRCSNFSSRTVGVGECKISDVICPRCTGMKSKTIASGSCTVDDRICERCDGLQTRTVGIGSSNVDHFHCPHCRQVETRSIGAGMNAIHDRICDNVKSVTTCTENDKPLMKDKQVGEILNLSSTGVSDDSISDLVCDQCSSKSDVITQEVGVHSVPDTKDVYCTATVRMRHIGCLILPEANHVASNTELTHPESVSASATMSIESKPSLTGKVERLSISSQESGETSPRELSSDSEPKDVALPAQLPGSEEDHQQGAYSDKQRQARIQYYTQRLQQRMQEGQDAAAREGIRSFENPMASFEQTPTKAKVITRPGAKHSRFAHRIKSGTLSTSRDRTSTSSAADSSSSSSSDSESSPEEGSYETGAGSISRVCFDDSSLANGMTSSLVLEQRTVAHRHHREGSKRYELGGELNASCKLLDDFMKKPIKPTPKKVLHAIAVIQREWFKASSQKSAEPLQVEDYLDEFEEISKELMTKIVNMSDNNGNTALHYSVSHGNFDIVSLLLDSKVCDVNKQNKAGYTAIMLASLAVLKNEAHRSVIQRLFNLGDVNIRASQHGQTALMLAVSHGRYDLVKLLIDAGAEVNIKDVDGSTALMCASEHGHLEIVKLLLAQADCDVTTTDNDGSTALSIAVTNGHRDIGLLIYAKQNLSRQGSPARRLSPASSKSPLPRRISSETQKMSPHSHSSEQHKS